MLRRRTALVASAATAAGFLTAQRAWAAPKPQAAQSQPAPTALAERGFRELADDMVRSGQTDGLAVVVVQNGHASYCMAGLGMRGASSPATADSVFEIGSISKVFSAQVLAHAVVAGRIDLQADIRQYLPGAFPNLAFEGKPIQVKHLVDTTSALPDNLPESDVLLKGHQPETHLAVIARHVAGTTYEQLLADLRQAWPRGPSGRKPAHSNLAAQLLGAILSKVYGQDYASLLNRFIERPFGMAASDRSHRPINTSGYASSASPAAPYLQGETFESAGGLAYSARDMGRFLNGVLSSPGSGVALARRVLWGDVSDTALAFGWQVSRTPDGALRYRASGGTLGYSSYIEVVPRFRYGVALLANRAGDAQGHLKWMAERGKDRLLGKPAALLDFERALQASQFKRIADAAADVKRRFPAFHLAQDLVDTWAFGLIFEGKKSEGLALLEYQAASRPRSVAAMLACAEASAVVGQPQLAAERFRRVLALEPDNEQAISRLQDLAGQR
jgi:D-alanyl-D-alanine-carboxypeptidase/D-alanyl-D-alanine-endopeptidase